MPALWYTCPVPRLVPTFLALLVAGSGCGYSLVRYGGALGDVRAVAVSTPSNESYEPGIEFVVADALRREILRRRGVRLVNDPEQADLVLQGSVLPIEASGVAFSSVSLTIEYQVTLSLRLEAIRAGGEPVAIDPRALQESERYLASADVQAARKNRDEALRRAASVVAERVYDALYETLVQ